VSTIPSYLLLSRHSVYYFRIVVPDVIRPLFPQREIRRSLQTRCKREALIRGRGILAQIQGLFTQRRQHATTIRVMTFNGYVKSLTTFFRLR